ncbi:rCG56122 [Rattus norvegicus]|uniref:RCG56122 n=1 Tax=Rattus norvegicus TaxID=10116 RepID=A6IBI3_RAT|nr:rCG56122 [Rattus norvegicus]
MATRRLQQLKREGEAVPRVRLPQNKGEHRRDWITLAYASSSTGTQAPKPRKATFNYLHKLTLFVKPRQECEFGIGLHYTGRLSN